MARQEMVQHSALRYSSLEKEVVEGWLLKEGRSLRARRNRFVRLSGSTLSSHRSKDGAASWELCVRDAGVARGGALWEILVTFPNRMMSFLAGDREDFERWIFALRRAALLSSRVEDYYRVGRMVGEGMNGQVRLASDIVTNEHVAIKMVPRLGRENEDEFLAREVQIILSLSHPNIVRTIDVFVRRRRIHFVMEYVPGGELFDFIAEHTNFTERHAASVMTDLLNALSYLHAHGIAHRDVKLENLLCAHDTWPLGVKLADFGFANFVRNGEDASLSSFVGTPYYIAPEMLRGKGHGRPVDIWACGVVMYILLSGKFPFGGNNEKEYYARVLSKEAYFPAQEWAHVSEEAKDLLRGMLCKDPTKRLTAAQCLAHTWITVAEAAAEPNDHEFPHDDLLIQQRLTSPQTFRHNRGKKGKWRNRGMLNRSLDTPTEGALAASAAAYDRHGASDGITHGKGADSRAANGGADGNSPGVSRRQSLMRRLLVSGKLSLDRYDGRFPSFRGNVDEAADEATATPRKTLSLFGRLAPTRRSFHRTSATSAAEPLDDSINFVPAHTTRGSQRLPPKLAREQQRLASQERRASRRGLFRFRGGAKASGSERSLSSSMDTSVGPSGWHPLSSMPVSKHPHPDPSPPGTPASITSGASHPLAHVPVPQGQRGASARLRSTEASGMHSASQGGSMGSGSFSRSGFSNQGGTSAPSPKAVGSPRSGSVRRSPSAGIGAQESPTRTNSASSVERRVLPPAVSSTGLSAKQRRQMLACDNPQGLTKPYGGTPASTHLAGRGGPRAHW